MTKAKRYTVKDLVRIHDQYEKNWVKLVDSVGTPRHAKFAKREHELNRQDSAAREHLKYKIKACPLGTRIQRNCEVCTGYYMSGSQLKKDGTLDQTRYHMIEEELSELKDSKKCAYKHLKYTTDQMRMILSIVSEYKRGEHG